MLYAARQIGARKLLNAFPSHPRLASTLLLFELHCEHSDQWRVSMRSVVDREGKTVRVAEDLRCPQSGHRVSPCDFDCNETQVRLVCSQCFRDLIVREVRDNTGAEEVDSDKRGQWQ